MMYQPSGPPAAPPNRSRRAITIGLAGTIAVLLTVIAVVATLAIRSRTASDDLPGITLQSVGTITENPFTSTVAFGKEVVDPATIGTANNRGVRGAAGTTPGLYGTTGTAACNPQLLSNYLRGDPGAARAWSSASGVSASQIPYYINTLTPVVLRTDSWVTNNQYRNGQAEPYQSILQSGTPVLVDRSGVPRVQCASGSPLAPPARAPLSGYRPHGAPWRHYKPRDVTVVDYRSEARRAGAVVPAQGKGYASGAPTVRVELYLIDVRSGAPCRQPVGGDVSLAGLPPLTGALPDPDRTNAPFIARTDVAARNNGLARADSTDVLPNVEERKDLPAQAPVPSAPDQGTDTRTSEPVSVEPAPVSTDAPLPSTTDTPSPPETPSTTETPAPSTPDTPSTTDTPETTPEPPSTTTAEAPPATTEYTPPPTTEYTPPPTTEYTPPPTTEYTPPPTTEYTPPPTTEYTPPPTTEYTPPPTTEYTPPPTTEEPAPTTTTTTEEVPSVS